MSADDHIPAYNRAKDVFGHTVIEERLEYRPSIFRDMWSLVKEIASRYNPPYTFERVVELFFITTLFPIFFTWGAYQAAYCAYLEKLEWDFENSKWCIEKKRSKESFTYPSYKLRPIIMGLIWSIPIFLAAILVYGELTSLYEVIVSYL